MMQVKLPEHEPRLKAHLSFRDASLASRDVKAARLAPGMMNSSTPVTPSACSCPSQPLMTLW